MIYHKHYIFVRKDSEKIPMQLYMYGFRGTKNCYLDYCQLDRCWESIYLPMPASAFFLSSKSHILSRRLAPFRELVNHLFSCNTFSCHDDNLFFNACINLWNPCNHKRCVRFSIKLANALEFWYIFFLLMSKASVLAQVSGWIRYLPPQMCSNKMVLLVLMWPWIHKSPIHQTIVVHAPSILPRILSTAPEHPVLNITIGE